MSKTGRGYLLFGETSHTDFEEERKSTYFGRYSQKFEEIFDAFVSILAEYRDRFCRFNIKTEVDGENPERVLLTRKVNEHNFPIVAKPPLV